MTWFVLTVSAFVLAVVLTKCLQMFIRSLSPPAAFLGVGGIIGGALCIWFVVGGFTMPGLATVLLYAGMCEFYLFVMTVVMTSVSAGILEHLPERSMSRDELAAHYAEESMVQLRFDRLLSQKLIAAEEDGFALTGRGRQLYGALAWVRRRLHGR